LTSTAAAVAPSRTASKVQKHRAFLNSVSAARDVGDPDIRIHNGVKYKRNGAGNRFVSAGNLINIDGEDYVEYRVLTKVN